MWQRGVMPGPVCRPRSVWPHAAGAAHSGEAGAVLSRVRVLSRAPVSVPPTSALLPTGPIRSHTATQEVSTLTIQYSFLVYFVTKMKICCKTACQLVLNHLHRTYLFSSSFLLLSWVLLPTIIFFCIQYFFSKAFLGQWLTIVEYRNSIIRYGKKYISHSQHSKYKGS